MKPSSSIEKVYRVLHAMELRLSMGVTEIAQQAGLIPSDVHRLLRSLEAFGFVEQDTETRKYKLGLELLKLGHIVHSRIELRGVARPQLVRLADATGGTANLAIVDAREKEIVFVDQVDSPQPIRISVRIGERVRYAHCTSVGKVLAAHMDPDLRKHVLAKHGLVRKTANTITNMPALMKEFEAIRAQGYAVDREEVVRGAVCVGAPIRDHSAHVIASVSVSLFANQLSESGEASLEALVKSTAAQISSALGQQQPQPKLRAVRSR